MKYLVEYLDDREAGAAEAKRKQTLDVKKSLDEQTREPKNKALAKDGPLNLDKCGPSSLQCFSGEDHAYEARKKAQQDQVKLWCAEDMIEKRKARDAAQREEREYAAYVLAQDRARAELEGTARLRQDEEARRRQQENREHARQAREWREREAAADRETQARQSHYLQTCPLLTEDTALAINVTATHRTRPDHFKGFGREMADEIHRENEARRREDDAEADEACVGGHHAEVGMRLSDAEEARRRASAAEGRLQRQVLARQKEELAARKAVMESGRLAEIGSEFFRKFGKSCR